LLFIGYSIDDVEGYRAGAFNMADLELEIYRGAGAYYFIKHIFLLFYYGAFLIVESDLYLNILIADEGGFINYFTFYHGLVEEITVV